MTELSIRKEGRAGRITLTRPKALNALTRGMLVDMARALDGWRDDPEVEVVVVDAEGERAFCAGGDILGLYQNREDPDHAPGFFTDEYRLNARVAEFPKPYLAFCQGYTMGGGVGISAHGSHCVVGDTSRIAMPECAIGLIPDVGGTLILGRAPGRIGDYLAVTGYRMGPGDAIHAGFADCYIPEDEWPDLIAALCDDGDPDAVTRAARPRPASPLAEDQEWIDSRFGGATAVDALRALAADGSERARETEALIRGGSPLSVAAAWEAVERARGFGTVREALSLEYRFSARAIAQGELAEGIRAAVVDKDRSPRWRHSRVEEVAPDEVAAMLAPLGADELDFEGDAA